MLKRIENKIQILKLKIAIDLLNEFLLKNPNNRHISSFKKELTTQILSKK